MLKPQATVTVGQLSQGSGSRCLLSLSLSLSSGSHPCLLPLSLEWESPWPSPSITPHSLLLKSGRAGLWRRSPVYRSTLPLLFYASFISTALFPCALGTVSLYSVPVGERRSITETSTLNLKGSYSERLQTIFKCKTNFNTEWLRFGPKTFFRPTH